MAHNSPLNGKDEPGWSFHIQEHQEAVFRLAYLLLGDAHDAEDVAQEAFIRAYRYQDTFDPSRPIKPWLLQITANLARNRRRSLGRYLYHLGRLARLDIPPSIDPEQEASKHVEIASLWRAIRQLSHSDQMIIYLRYFLELTIEETAAALDIPAGTVKSRLHRAVERLRVVVQKDFPMLWRLADE
jgi:RNA polymerase sigma-70 factor (ECF subfamily)